jgi:hypothetical protein
MLRRVQTGEERFVLGSRGDLVHGRLRRHPRAAERALALVLSPDGAADHPVVERVFAALAELASVASIDLPLCGARHSDKLTEIAFDDSDPVAARLRPDLERQLEADLAITLRWLRSELGTRAAVRILMVGERAALCAGLRLEAVELLRTKPSETTAALATLAEQLR